MPPLGSTRSTVSAASVSGGDIAGSNKKPYLLHPLTYTLNRIKAINNIGFI